MKYLLQAKTIVTIVLAATLCPFALGATPATPNSKIYRMTSDTCPLYRVSNHAWIKVDPHEIPIGSEITGTSPPGREDIIYVHWVDHLYGAKVKCLTQVNSPAVNAPNTVGEEAVDLGDANAVESVTDGAQVGGKSALGDPQHQAAGVMPNFRVYFDFNLVDRPGIENLSFDNYHSYLFFEILPTPDISFSFDVNPTPRYYELDYQLTKKLQMRVGKIWIPFDDLSPHNLFGGRVNISKLAVGPAFLPDLWTDMGVGAKYQFIDKKTLSLEGQLYVVNGFGEGGTDPTGQSPYYPNFSDLTTGVPDNNREKSFGGRLHAVIENRLGLGVSTYRGRWSNDNHDSENLSMYGTDAQLRFNKTEIRFGLIIMKVDLPTGPFTRGGYYVEVGQNFGHKDMWKILGRGGQVQNDDRVTAATDQKIVGATLLVQPNILQYSIEYSRDVQQSPLKTNYSYTDFRIVMAF